MKEKPNCITYFGRIWGAKSKKITPVQGCQSSVRLTLTLDLGKGHTYLSIGCVFSGIVRSLSDESGV